MPTYICVFIHIYAYKLCVCVLVLVLERKREKNLFKERFEKDFLKKIVHFHGSGYHCFIFKIAQMLGYLIAAHFVYILKHMKFHFHNFCLSVFLQIIKTFRESQSFFSVYPDIIIQYLPSLLLRMFSS